MKHVKKLLAMVLALVMVMSLAVSAFAEENEGETETFKITVTTSESGASVEGHTYEVYQIFTGDVAADGVTLSNVAFGQNYAPEGKTVDDALAELSGMNGVAAADYLVANKTGTAFGSLNDENGHELNAVPGYYLIIDVTADENLPENETKSAYILQVLEDVEIKSKHDTTPVTYKKIDDINDSTGEGAAIEWHDSADHDIGDEIDFQLNAVIPSTIGAFRADNQAYPFTFHDVEESGLTFKEIKEVYVVNGTGENAVKTPIDASKYSLVKDVAHENEETCTFEVRFTDLTAIPEITSGSVLVVEYKSVLNENAVIGEEGNVNKMRGEYKNYNSPEGPHYTPWDSVIAFTYKVEINKVDEEGAPLAGAEFTLEKYYAATNEWKPIAKVETEADTVFTFEGLDDGKYRLTETATPDGYNSIEPIEFTVTAEHDILWETQNREDVLTSLSGDKVVGEITFTVDEENEDALTADVENKSGVVLPETGGIGTTIFYVLGSAMVIVAVVFLVTKKRMNNAE